jgi:tetratricopeptide (TPR) repeat protein
MAQGGIGQSACTLSRAGSVLAINGTENAAPDVSRILDSLPANNGTPSSTPGTQSGTKGLSKSSSTSGTGAGSGNSPLETLRDALKSHDITMKLQGDGMHTTSVRLLLSNTTKRTIKIVIPANEVLHPNTLTVQTMLISHDIVAEVPAGQTAIVEVQTVCASVKTIQPPPGVTDGLDFSAGDYADPAVWAQLASIIAAGQELSNVGAFGKLLMASDAVIKQEIADEVKTVLAKSVTDYMMQNPGTSQADAEQAIANDKKQMDAITQTAENTVMRKEKRKQLDQITQLAIWRLLGIKSGKPDEAVTPVSMVDDFLKQLSLQAKTEPSIIDKFGGKTDKNGNIIASPKQREGLESAYNAVFSLVDLTVKRSSEAGLTGVASLPKDDPCDTFCSVGERAYNQGDFTTSQELLGSAVQLAETFGEADARLSRSLNSLGLCYLNMTYFSDAKKNLDRALELRTKVCGPESKEVAEVDNNLGVLNQVTAQYPTADKLFNEAVNIFEKTSGKTSPPVAACLNNLGKTLCLETKPEDGANKLKLALALAIVNSPQNVGGDKCYTPFVAEVETNLADAYKDSGKSEMAGEFYKKALDTDKKVLGPDHPFIANILDGLSQVTGKLGQTAESEDFKKQADQIRERSFQSGSKDLATLPLSTADLGRLWNYIQGKKDIQFSIATVRAASSAPTPLDTTRGNKPIRDKWALVVGISKFKDPTISLQYAAKDAQDFGTYLKTEGNFAPDHVRILTNERATRAEILKEITSWLPRVSNPDDLVVIFFSSHGSPSSLDLANVNFLVSYDTDKYNLAGTAIQLQDFADLIKKYVHSDRIVLCMDACHSGAATGAKGLFRNQNLDAADVAQGTGQLVICSSLASQSSWESTRYKNGVFTHYLIEGLRKDGDKSKLKDVFKYMKDGVYSEVQRDRNGVEQTPNMQTKWVGNDLMIGVKPADPHPGIADDWHPEPVVNPATKTVPGGPAAKAAGGKSPATGSKAPAGPAAKAGTAISKQPATTKAKTAVH